MLHLYPAIDLRAGRAVRLLRGDFDAETVYADDPVAVARSFSAAGAAWIHVVDLDAARTGEPANLAAIEGIAAARPLPGPGRRRCAGTSTPPARFLLAGAARAVVGTAAIERPAFVEELCAAHPGRAAVGLDAPRPRARPPRAGPRRAATTSSTAPGSLDAVGVSALVVTEISRDGTMTGLGPRPARRRLRRHRAARDRQAAGRPPRRTLDALAGLEADGRRLAGAVIGRALYEGRFTLAEALTRVGP